MPMYYQKHRTIHAFQYDGTLKCLRDHLPDALWAEILADMHNYVYQATTANPNRDYTLMWICPIWPNQHQKLAHPKRHWKATFGINSIRMMHANIVLFKFETVKKYLTKGDYVMVKYRPIPQRNYYNGRTHLQWVMQFQLIFETAANFTAHWSQTPISHH